ncbi:MAG: SAF domain-containing protein [Frankiaceae bacterium]
MTGEGWGGAGALRDLRRLARRHRGPLSALLAAAAVLAALSALRPAAPATVAVLTAAHRLPAGEVLAARDVATARLPPSVVPDGALRPGDRVVGRALAGPVRRGEPLTDVRLAGAALLAAAPPRRSPGSPDGASLPAGDTVAAPVRIADQGAVALVRAGDRIDVLATPPDGAGPAVVVAGDVLVLATPRDGPDAAAADGALVLVETSRQGASELARAAVGDRLSLTLLGG